MKNKKQGGCLACNSKCKCSSRQAGSLLRGDALTFWLLVDPADPGRKRRKATLLSTIPGRGDQESWAKESISIAAFPARNLSFVESDGVDWNSPFDHLSTKRYALFGPLLLRMGALCRCKHSLLCQCHSSCLRNDANQMERKADRVYIYKWGFARRRIERVLEVWERAQRIINSRPLAIIAPWWSATASASQFVIRADSIGSSAGIQSSMPDPFQDDMARESIDPLSPLE